MVKYLILLSAMLSFNSCTTKTTLLEDGLTKVPSEDDFFKNKHMFHNQILKHIETDVIYVEEYSYLSKDNDFQRKNEKLEVATGGQYKTVYRFYKNGCVNLFTINQLEDFTLNTFNPDYRGSRGVYYLKNNYVNVDFFGVKGYFLGKDYGVLSKKIKIEGDTLLIKSNSEKNYIQVFSKQRIPNEYLKYNADW